MQQWLFLRLVYTFHTELDPTMTREAPINDDLADRNPHPIDCFTHNEKATQARRIKEEGSNQTYQRQNRQGYGLIIETAAQDVSTL